ncbi:hypothetical protein B0H65DRAFT_417472, partial [Neurospora tetraspora]
IDNFELEKLIREISEANKIKIIRAKVFRKKYRSKKGFFFLKVSILNNRVRFIRDSLF